MWSRGFEGTTEAFVVWKRKGAVLSPEAVLDTALIGSIGHARIREIHDAGPGKHLILGRTSGGDDGKSRGTVWAALWTEPRSLRILFETHYSSAGMDETTVDLTYRPKDRALDLVKRRRNWVGYNDHLKPPPWTTENAWTEKIRLQ